MPEKQSPELSSELNTLVRTHFVEPLGIAESRRLLRREPTLPAAEEGVKSSSLGSSESPKETEVDEMTRLHTSIKTVNWPLTNS